MVQMNVGFVGLGRMGLPMALNVHSHLSDAKLLTYDLALEARRTARAAGLNVVENLVDLCSQLPHPRVVWLMVPAGEGVDTLLSSLIPHLTAGDIVIDGGNSHFQDSIRRKMLLREHEIEFVGAGVSGGIEGAKNGPPITLDCKPEVYELILPLLNAFKGSHSYFPDAGKGHKAKIIHNAIEYGMMQSLAEGVALYYRHGFTSEEVRDVFKTWQKGSIIESKFVDYLNRILESDDLLTRQKISKSETVKQVEAVLLPECPTPAIKAATQLRHNPEQQDPIALTTLAQLRKVFGGHALQKRPDETLMPEINVWVDYFLSEMRRLLKEHDRIYIGLPGGRSLDAFYQKLAQSWDDRNLESIQFFLVDERCTEDHEELNINHLTDIFLKPLESKLNQEASIYVPRSVEEFPFPRADLLVLSCGEDGHVASLFPSTPALKDRSRKIIRIENAPKAPASRYSIAPAIIRESHSVLLFFVGSGKRPAYQRFQDQATTSESIPAKLVKERRSPDHCTIFCQF